MNWTEVLGANPLPWLLGPENPPLSRQLADGTWFLDQKRERLPFDAGRPGEPNRWLTLDVLKMVKLLYEP
jgi:hypothetical protein